MRAVPLGIVGAIVLYELSKWAQEMAGPPGKGPPKDDDEPRTVADLRAEFRGLQVPESIYTVFGKGAQHQLRGQDQDAWQEYTKLRRIPRRSGGTFDLARVSRTLRHNLRLLGKGRDESTNEEQGRGGP